MSFKADGDGGSWVVGRQKSELSINFLMSVFFVLVAVPTRAWLGLVEQSPGGEGQWTEVVLRWTLWVGFRLLPQHPNINFIF